MVEQVSDFKMPEKLVSRLLKDALPEDVVLSKDAKNAACRSASIFILQLSIAAAEKAQMNKRRTLENQDIIKAVTDLGLGEYAPQLVRFGAQRKRNAKRKEKCKPGKKTAETNDSIFHENQEPMESETPDQEPMSMEDEEEEESQQYQINENND